MKQLNWAYFIPPQTGIAAYAQSAPGQAKTASLRCLAQHTGRRFLPCYLDQMLPEDIGGVPAPRTIEINGQGVGLVAKVLSGMRLRDGIQVYVGDTGIQHASKVFKPSDIVIAGGGGTDVGAMLEQVYEQAKVKPDVMIGITDGYTPYPDKPLPCRVVICLTQKEGAMRYPVPSWIKSVVLEC